jgi:hypothetical protein
MSPIYIIQDMDVADDDDNIVPDGQRPAARKANEKLQEEVDVLGPDSEVYKNTIITHCHACSYMHGYTLHNIIITLSCMQLHAWVHTVSVSYAFSAWLRSVLHCICMIAIVH